MYCRKCGSPNEEGARFCAKCGAEIEPPQEQEEKVKKAKRVKLWSGAAAILLAAAVLAGYFAMKNVDAKGEYEEYMAKADKYLETMDYEKAETEYLKAIAIDPKQEEPYVKLAELYEANGEPKKAESILAKADKKVPEKNRKKLKQKKEEIKQNTEQKENYKATWESEPQIEAEAIYYLAESDYYKKPANELKRQFFSPYAVIQSEEGKGLIGIDGEMEGGLEYKEIHTYVGEYLLERSEPVYDDEMQNDWTMYRISEDTDGIEPAWGLGGGVPMDVFYEYEGNLASVLDDMEGSFHEYRQDMPEGAFPVRHYEQPYTNDTIDEYYEEWMETGGLYAVYNDGMPVTDFIYEECGTASSGLLAVKKDGRWGYVDESGKEVIPAEFDASWHYYSTPESYGEEYEDYCYAATEGYVVLCKEGQWEMRDTSGETVIPSGIYEELLPVYEGKCWAKKDGRWGILQIYEWKEDETQEDVDEADVQESRGSDSAYTVYESGPVERTGTIQYEKGMHPNGEELDVLLLKLDTPAGFRVGGGAEEETTYDNCTDIQIFNPISNMDESWDGKHVKVTGQLRGDAHTAYYFRNYVIDSANISEIR